MKIILGTALFAFAAVAVVVASTPYLIVHSRFGLPFDAGSLRFSGLVPMAAGALFWLWSAWDFVFFGRGTPAPLYPPRNLVSRRLYRLVRNPMYLAVALMLLGEALVFGSLTLLAYALAVWLVFHLFVVYFEEPNLGAFGGQYDEYRSRVSRWLPRF